MTQVDFTLSATGSAVDVRWGSDFPDQTFHFWQHPNNANGQGPTFCYEHGGGHLLFDARYPFLNGTDLNPELTRIMARTTGDGPFYNLCSINTPQIERSLYDATYPYQQVDQLGNSHTGTAALGWDLPCGWQEHVTAPYLFQQTRMAIMAAKSFGETRGAHPDQWIACGSSAGGLRSIIAQLSGTMKAEDLTDGVRMKYGIHKGVDSKMRAMILMYPQVDVRRGTPYILAAGGTSTTYPTAGLAIRNLCGVRTTAQLNLVPDEVLNRLSLLWYLEQANVNTAEAREIRSRFVPMYLKYTRINNAGGGSNPFGTPTYPLPDGASHDEQQLFNVETTVKAQGLRRMLRSSFINLASVGVAADDPSGRTYPELLSDDMWGFANEALIGGGTRAGRGPVYWSNAAGAYYPILNPTGE